LISACRNRDDLEECYFFPEGKNRSRVIFAPFVDHGRKRRAWRRRQTACQEEDSCCSTGQERLASSFFGGMQDVELLVLAFVYFKKMYIPSFFVYLFLDVIPDRPPEKSPSKLAEEADRLAREMEGDDDVVVVSSQLGTSNDRRHNTTGVREHLLLMAQEAERERKRKRSQYFGSDDEDFVPSKQMKKQTPKKMNPKQLTPQKQMPPKTPNPKKPTPQKQTPKNTKSYVSKEWTSDEEEEHASDDSKGKRKGRLKRYKGRFDGIGEEYMNRRAMNDYQDNEEDGEGGVGSDYKEEEEGGEEEGGGEEADVKDDGIGDDNGDEN
jgi:hypothetical protein